MFPCDCTTVPSRIGAKPRPEFVTHFLQMIFRIGSETIFHLQSGSQQWPSLHWMIASFKPTCMLSNICTIASNSSYSVEVELLMLDSLVETLLPKDKDKLMSLLVVRVLLLLLPEWLSTKMDSSQLQLLLHWSLMNAEGYRAQLKPCWCSRIEL